MEQEDIQKTNDTVETEAEIKGESQEQKNIPDAAGSTGNPEAGETPEDNSEAPPEEGEVYSETDSTVKKNKTGARIREEKQSAADRQKALRDSREEFLTGWAQLIIAKKAGLILRGLVVAISTKTAARTVEVRGETHRIAQYPVAFARVLLNGMYNVEIPFEEFFLASPIDPDTVDFSTRAGLDRLQRRQFSMMQKLNGLEVPFLIREMDRSADATVQDHFIYGSRRDALIRMQQESFIGNRNREPNYRVGDVVDAEVIAAGTQGLLLCVGGAETRVHAPALTYRYVQVASDCFAVGSTIPVQITELESDGDELKSISVSRKPLETADVEKRGLKAGDLVQGTIVAVHKEKTSGFISAVAWLNQLEIPAFITSFAPRRGYGSIYSEPPKSGDICALEVGARSADGQMFTTTKSGLVITRFRTLIRRGD